MKIIDLTHLFGKDTPSYPGDPRTRLSQIKSLERDGYNLNLIYTSMHTGTHIDMPSHMIADDRLAERFEPELFIGSGVLLDVRNQNPIGMRKDYEKRIKKGDIVLLYTGFDKWYKNPDIYFERHPTVDETLADFLIASEIKMLGLDMPAPDHPPFSVHKKLLTAGIFILENLTGLERLNGVGEFEVLRCR